jgi:hypothetical protein
LVFQLDVFGTHTKQKSNNQINKMHMIQKYKATVSIKHFIGVLLQLTQMGAQKKCTKNTHARDGAHLQSQLHGRQ